jgi:hypothetical protein
MEGLTMEEDQLKFLFPLSFQDEKTQEEKAIRPE